MKKTLAILLALVLCLSAVAMIACNKCEHNFVDGVCTKCGDKDPNYKPGGGNDVDVPVAEGKVTFYFTMAADSVEMPSYASVYFAGGQSSTGSTANGDYVWPTNLAAPEFTKMENSNVYYIQLVYDANKEQADEYALVLGYNKSSGLPDDKCGLVWNDAYKSDYCATFAFGSNAQFEYTEGQKTINLGTHKFSTKVAAPETCDEVTLKITLSAPLGENGEVYIMGGFNGWDAAKAKATANEARDVYSVTLTDILCTNYDYKVLIIRDKTAATTTKTEEGKDPVDLGIWDWNMTEPVFPEGVEHDDESVIRAYIEVGATDGGNLAMAILKADDGSYIDLAGTISETNADREEVKTGLDLAQIDLVEGKDGEVGNNIFTYKYQTQIPEKTLVVTFTEALPETTDIYVIGSFRMNEAGTGWGMSIADAKMTVAEDRLSASVTYEMAPAEYDFQVFAVHKDIRLKSVQSIWDYATKLDNSNSKVTVTGYADGEVELYAEAREIPTFEAPVYADNTITLKVKFDKEVPAGKHVIIAGSFEGYTGMEMTVDAEDATVYTIQLEDILVKEYECKVGISDTTAMNWTGAYGADGSTAGSAGNQKFDVAKNSTTIDVYGETVLVAPVADKFVETVTLKITFATSQTGKNVWLAGELTSWGGNDDNKMTASEDGKVFTLTLTHVKVGTFGFKLCVTSGAEFSWDYCLGSNAPSFGGDNASVTIAEDSTVVVLFANINEGVIELA